MRRLLPTCIVLTVLTLGSTSGRTLLVPQEYPGIQAAIMDAQDGDVVVVSPDEYYETINFGGRNIVVTSIDPNDPEIVEETAIIGDEEGSTVIFENGETRAAVLRGFTITGGYGTPVPEIFGNEIYWGAGIFIKESSPTIMQCVVADNHGPLVFESGNEQIGYGGAIATVMSDALITNNILRDNSCYAGAGIMTYMGDPLIRNNLIHSNSAFVAGGVVLFGGRLLNNTIVANNVDLGIQYGELGFAGNIYTEGDSEFSPSRIAGNIIALATSGGGMYHNGLANEDIAYNNVWGNTPGNYLSQQPGMGDVVYDGPSSRTGISGNISVDPIFEAAHVRDYRIREGSPCISAGDPTYAPDAFETDIEGDPRIYAVLIDIGADEFVGYIHPVADAGPDQHLLAPGPVALDGSNSFFHDPQGETEYIWEQIEGLPVSLTDPESATPSFYAPEAGRYVFDLVVGDGMGLSRPDKVLILVGNQPPVAIAGPNQVCEAPSTVRLDGSASYDPDGIDVITYEWTQVAGPPVELVGPATATPSFMCETGGLYRFQLVVSDPFAVSEPSFVEVVTVGVTVIQQALGATVPDVSYYFYPDVSGPHIVYAAGSFSAYDWDIKCRNTITQEVTTITAGRLDTHPKIDGDIVVWAGGSAPPYNGYQGRENLSVFARSLTTGVQVTLAQHDNYNSFSHPAVSGNTVVWLEHRGIDKNSDGFWRNMPFNIVGADISDLQNPVPLFIFEEGGERDPYNYNEFYSDYDSVIDICGSIVVWEGGGDIFAADLSDAQDIQVYIVCMDSAVQKDPAIFGRTVVWTDMRNDSGDIYGADISDWNNIREFPVVRRSGMQHQPAIDGCLVTYCDGGTYGGYIRLACLTGSGSILDITLQGSYYGVWPAIDGDTLVWVRGVFSEPQAAQVQFAYSIGDGDVENLTQGTHYDYIQHAIVEAESGDIIRAAPRRYNENISMYSKSLRITSMDPNDPSVVAATIIDGMGRAPAASFVYSEGPQSILDGLTLTNGSTGIYCRATEPSFVNCRVVGNRGAGITLSKESKVNLRGCLIADNGSHGIDMPAVADGRFMRHNFATLVNCIVARNQGCGLAGSMPTAINCTITQNNGGGINAVRPTVCNSIVYANGHPQIVASSWVITYSDIMGGWPGDGNIDTDPMFADAANGDYHLMSQQGRWDSNAGVWVLDGVSSLCIDAGDPNPMYLGGEPSPNGAVVNLGAYGGTAQASMTFDPGCFPQDDPAYEDWLALGRPSCWCYRRQCHGDADGRAEGGPKTGYFHVHFNDLNVLLAAWNVLEPPDGPGVASVVGPDGVTSGLCADFSHSVEGGAKTGYYRVHFCDLGRLVANWRVKEPPDGPGVPPDCGGTLEP